MGRQENTIRRTVVEDCEIIKSTAKSNCIELGFPFGYGAYPRRRLAFLQSSYRCAVVTFPPTELFLPYSSRSRIIGSTASARCAGIHEAMSPRTSMVTITPPSTQGSFGVA
jgi:hypothetical protein